MIEIVIPQPSFQFLKTKWSIYYHVHVLSNMVCQGESKNIWNIEYLIQVEDYYTFLCFVPSYSCTTSEKIVSQNFGWIANFENK